MKLFGNETGEMDAPSVQARLGPGRPPLPPARRRPLRLIMAQACRSHTWLSQQSGGANSLRGGAPSFGQLQMAPKEATSAAPRAATRLTMHTPSQHERSTNTVVQKNPDDFAGDSHVDSSCMGSFSATGGRCRNLQHTPGRSLTALKGRKQVTQL